MENYPELSNQAGKNLQTIQLHQEAGIDYISRFFFSFVVSLIEVNVSSNKQIYRDFYSISPIKCKNV